MSALLEMQDYTVAWIAPLATEAAAACQLLDEHHGAPARSLGQTLTYFFGRIGKHNVAISCFPAGECGIGVAGMMATEMKRDLPSLKIGLLVGIGAGITSPMNDIQLGDVAVAIPEGDKSGVIGYDLVKIEPEKIVLKQWQNSTSLELRSAITKLRTRFIASNGSDRSLLSHLDRFNNTSFVRPQASSLSSAGLNHNHQPRQHPIVHHGTIASGNKVIKSEKYRDELSREHNAIAIEMEAAGIMNTLPVAVIRGISDFGDSAKNDQWHLYAASTAAAYARELLEVLDPTPSINRLTRTDTIPLSDVHLLNLLTDRAKDMNINNNWRNSVVDLLKLLSLDSSLGARARLAKKWNVFVGKDGDAERNIALYGLIMSTLARNQGQVPASLVKALSLDG